jgi:hypothetical protein
MKDILSLMALITSFSSWLLVHLSMTFIHSSLGRKVSSKKSSSFISFLPDMEETLVWLGFQSKVNSCFDTLPFRVPQKFGVFERSQTRDKVWSLQESDARHASITPRNKKHFMNTNLSHKWHVWL